MYDTDGLCSIVLKNPLMEFLCFYFCDLQNLRLAAHEYVHFRNGLLIITRIIKMLSFNNGFYGGSKANYLLTAACISTVGEDYKYLWTYVDCRRRRNMNISLPSPSWIAAVKTDGNKEDTSDRLPWQMRVVCAAEGKKEPRMTREAV